LRHRGRGRPRRLFNGNANGDDNDSLSEKSVLWSAALGAGMIMATPVLAADMAIKAPRLVAYDRCAKIEPLPGTPAIPGGDIYGMTSPTDIGDPCSWAFATEFTGRAGKRDGSYLAITDKNQFSYTWSNRLAFAFSPFITYNNWSNVTVAAAAVGVASFNATQFDGLSGEVAYRILARSPGQPVAITLSSEPRWARVDGLTGWRTEAYGNEFKFFADIALTERVFAAANLSYGLARSRLDLPGALWTDTSSTTVSAALTAQVYAQEKAAIEAIYLGVEGRFLSAFNGLTLNQNVGNGFFFGPTMAIAFAGGRMLNVVWVPQVAGRALPASAPGPLDLDNFERAQFRVKFATPLQ
jgi:hypothetical protein